MSGDDADFAAYLAARWPPLVRSVVLLGCSRPEAEDVVTSGLARCYTAWERVRRADDVDAHVYRTVLDCWHRRQRRRGAAPAEVPAEVPVGPVAVEDVSDQVRLRRALEVSLSALTPEHREVLVLRFVAGLSEVQVAEVLDVPVGTVTGRTAEALSHVDLAALREVRG